MQIRTQKLRKVCALFSAIVVLLSAGCSGLLYYPDDLLYTDPDSSFDQAPDDVVIRAVTGEENHAWYFRSLQSRSKAIIVFCHGNGQNRSAHIVGLYWLVREGYDLLAIDYPGYADNDGSPTPQNTVESAKAAIRYARARSPELPLIVYGQSLGGAIALRAVIDLRTEIPPRLVVADSTFLSYKHAAKLFMREHWFTWVFQPLAGLMFNDEYAPGDQIAEINSPLLVIHSKEDEVVPFALGREVFDKAREPKEFWPLEKGAHISTFLPRQDTDVRKKFLATLAKMGM